MEKTKINKLILMTIIFFTSTGMISGGYNSSSSTNDVQIKTLLYDNIWGTIYNPTTKQCDETPNITGDGSKINSKKASKCRWIAISQDMLNCEYRKSLLLYERTNLYKGKIRYGDTVWIESSNIKINGWWVVHDTKNARFKKSIDFLQTNGDGSLYSYESTWSGKFDDNKIYTLNNVNYKTYKNHLN